MKKLILIILALTLMGWGSDSEPNQAEQARPAQTENASAQGPENSCEKHIELHGSKFWAKELGKSEMWVLANYRIPLWQNPRPSKGRKVGEMRVGSRALILEEKAEDYRVRSPADASVGWVSKIQVAHTLYQRVKTFEPCTPPEALNSQEAPHPLQRVG